MSVGEGEGTYLRWLAGDEVIGIDDGRTGISAAYLRNPATTSAPGTFRALVSDKVALDLLRAKTL